MSLYALDEDERHLCHQWCYCGPEGQANRLVIFQGNTIERGLPCEWGLGKDQEGKTCWMMVKRLACLCPNLSGNPIQWTNENTSNERRRSKQKADAWTPQWKVQTLRRRHSYLLYLVLTLVLLSTRSVNCKIHAKLTVTIKQRNHWQTVSPSDFCGYSWTWTGCLPSKSSR